MEKEKIKSEDNDKKIERYIKIFFIIGFILILFNQFQLMSIQNSNNNLQTIGATSVAIVEASEVIPKGTPEIYGKELGVNYNDVSPNNPALADKTIAVLGNLDRTIILEGINLDRYITITSQISCEYCCGAESIIVRKEDVNNLNKKIEEAINDGKITREQADKYRTTAGNAACGCAHSYAMRGLAKYLVSEHGNEFTNEEVLEELGKWKTLFFPSQMSSKAQALKQAGIEFNYINLASNKYRGIETSSSPSSGMVGGC